MGEIPYYPGYEPLWVGGGDVARAQVDETEIVHPIADGAEAYYTYETGDSVSFKLPDGKVIQLRELRVRPRQPKWNLGVGSLWFDTRSGQLVRAAYRLSVPMDIWAVATEDDPKSMDDVPVWVKPLITPMKAEVSAIAVEYSLHEGRFWLPRLRYAEAYAQVSFMRVPVKVEESFKYASVNGTDTLPTIPLPPPRLQPPDSLSEDAAHRVARLRAYGHSRARARGARLDSPRAQEGGAAHHAVRHVQLPDLDEPSLRNGDSGGHACSVRHGGALALAGAPAVDLRRRRRCFRFEGSGGSQGAGAFARRAGAAPVQPRIAAAADIFVRAVVDAVQPRRRLVGRRVGRATTRRRLQRPGDRSSRIRRLRTESRVVARALEPHEDDPIHRVQSSRVGERLGASAHVRQLVLGTHVRPRRRVLLSRVRRRSHAYARRRVRRRRADGLAAFRRAGAHARA